VAAGEGGFVEGRTAHHGRLAPHPRPLSPPGRGEKRDDAAGEVGVDQAFEGFEGTAVFLAEPGFAQGAAFLGEEVGSDARDFVGGDLNSVPIVAAGGPAVVEEAAFAVGGGEANETAVAGGQHGADGAIKVVGDSGGFVDDQ